MELTKRKEQLLETALKPGFSDVFNWDSIGREICWWGCHGERPRKTQCGVVVGRGLWCRFKPVLSPSIRVSGALEISISNWLRSFYSELHGSDFHSPGLLWLCTEEGGDGTSFRDVNVPQDREFRFRNLSCTCRVSGNLYVKEARFGVTGRGIPVTLFGGALWDFLA